jgi:hypothetical protein
VSKKHTPLPPSALTRIEALRPSCESMCDAGMGNRAGFREARDLAAVIAAEHDVIAADLLAALRLAIKLLRTHADPESLGGERLDLTDCKDMAPIFAAIAKATGAPA